MSERRKTHHGRDRSGHFKVKQTDVDDLETDPEGSDFVTDDVRLGGAIADTGPQAGQRGARIGRLVEENRENAARAEGDGAAGRRRGKRKPRRQAP